LTTCNTSAVAVCCARLGQEPRILHCDHRLCREVLQQRDLLLRKLPHLKAGRGNQTQKCVVSAQRHKQHGSDARKLYRASKNRMVYFRAVSDLDEGFALDQRTACR